MWHCSARRVSPEPRTRMSEPIIAVQHITKQVADSTGTLTILHDINFELRAQESVAIVGAAERVDRCSWGRRSSFVGLAQSAFFCKFCRLQLAVSSWEH